MAHTISNFTQYSKQMLRAAATCFEAQVISGDSGSGVYHKRNGVWELAGITANIFPSMVKTPLIAVYKDVPSSEPTVFITGDASAFVDLSSYYSQITSIMSRPSRLLFGGRLGLGWHAGAAADIAAFVAGWRCNNGTGTGTITSWKNGDVTHDGKTDVNDFLRFRSSLTPERRVLTAHDEQLHFWRRPRAIDRDANPRPVVAFALAFPPPAPAACGLAV